RGTRRRRRRFFTPRHALLYSGFAAAAVALGARTLLNLRAADARSSPVALAVRSVRDGLREPRWPAALPAGYELSALGVVIFGVSGVADLTWHVIFGIE